VNAIQRENAPVMIAYPEGTEHQIGDVRGTIVLSDLECGHSSQVCLTVGPAALRKALSVELTPPHVLKHEDGLRPLSRSWRLECRRKLN